MASSDAPTRTLTYYSRLALWLAILIIAAGLFSQSLQINLLTQSNVDESFSQAITEQIDRAFKLRLQDTKDLQRAVSRHPYTLNALQEGDAAWLADLRGFLPGSQQVFVVNAEAAKDLNLSLGYTVQELVSRTLKGAEMRLEAVNTGGKQSFYWTTPIYNGDDIEGVLLVEYGTSWLTQLQHTISPNLGQTVLTQRFTDHGKGIELFNIGTAASNSSLAVTLPVNDIWFLTFTPNDNRPKLAIMPLTTPWIGVILTTLVALALLTFLQGREIRQNQFKLITFVRALTRQGGAELPKFSIRIFHDLATGLASQIQPSMSGISMSDMRTEKPDLAIEPLRQSAYRAAQPSADDGMMVVEEVPHDETEQNESDTH